MTKKKKTTKKFSDTFPKPRVQYQVERVQKTFEKPSMTEQAHADGCDLKLIMRRYVSTGELPLGNTRGQPSYMDAPDQEFDYKHAQDVLASVKSGFYELDPQQQSLFNGVNDYVDAITDPTREPELLSKGILTKIEAEFPAGEDIPSPADSERSEGAEGTSEASQKQSEGTTSEG